MRYFIEVAYNGKNYFGWQKQPNGITVQEVLENALGTVLRQEINIIGAGRTDTGVHAKQIFAHFDSEEIHQIPDLIFRLNSFLPKDISVQNIFSVKDDAHARFDAVEREYEYKIILQKDPFLQDFAYQIHNIPDVDLMNQAALSLLNHQDFQCFSRTNTDVKTYHCKITKAVWDQQASTLVFTIIADRFLRNMVRSIVGTLLEVGFGKTSLKDFQKILESKKRSEAGASVPAHGLYLIRVSYPDRIKN